MLRSDLERVPCVKQIEHEGKKITYYEIPTGYSHQGNDQVIKAERGAVISGNNNTITGLAFSVTGHKNMIYGHRIKVYGDENKITGDENELCTGSRNKLIGQKNKFRTADLAKDNTIIAKSVNIQVANKSEFDESRKRFEENNKRVREQIEAENRRQMQAAMQNTIEVRGHLTSVAEQNEDLLVGDDLVEEEEEEIEEEEADFEEEEDDEMEEEENVSESEEEAEFESGEDSEDEEMEETNEIEDNNGETASTTDNAIPDTTVITYRERRGIVRTNHPLLSQSANLPQEARDLTAPPRISLSFTVPSQESQTQATYVTNSLRGFISSHYEIPRAPSAPEGRDEETDEIIILQRIASKAIKDKMKDKSEAERIELLKKLKASLEKLEKPSKKGHLHSGASSSSSSDTTDQTDECPICKENRPIIQPKTTRQTLRDTKDIYCTHCLCYSCLKIIYNKKLEEFPNVFSEFVNCPLCRKELYEFKVVDKYLPNNNSAKK